ncbi:BAG family molecular chaperone regulator 4-like isoform X1 [Abrus precatorius]|uniref:BAG family molecular chaperone regulator 4-like isoform X1 n=1 Tax=Abrus precatorius TaxID=3816 RepID=A0A8B8L603_ABRPR|nr:BAG family molecular chaperone regulator 4-like isoform X1 [Abrus precatorius]
MEKVEWEMRPGGMFVQRRQVGLDEGPIINITVSHSSSQHPLPLYLPSHSTFFFIMTGDVKKLLAHKTGLKPEEQRLFFEGKEKENEEHLHVEGVKDKSKLLLLEDAASKERKLEEIRKHDEMLKASEAVAGVRAEVDKLSERVSALEVAVDGGTRVSDKEFVMSTELLMRQLLKLDGIEAEGEAKLQRKHEVRRVQNFVDTLDSLKARNSNPFSNIGKAVSVTTQWETFHSGMGSLNAPTKTSSSTNVTQHWEQFD